MHITYKGPKRRAGRFRRNKLPFLPRVSLNIVRGYDVMGQPGNGGEAVSAKICFSDWRHIREAQQKALADCDQIAGSRCRFMR